MPELSEVRRFAELFVRVGLVRGEGGDYVLSVLSTLMGCWATVGMVFLVCVHVRDLLTSIDTNMDINYAEMILKHVLDKHEGTAEANTLYEEVAKRINAGGLKRAREVCEAVINGDLII